VEHLFISCPFAKGCWESIQLSINLNPEPYSNLESLRALVAPLDGASVQGCRLFFLSEADGLLLRAKKSLLPKVAGMDNQCFQSVRPLAVQLLIFFLVP
jgi:hypothetical protein